MRPRNGLAPVPDPIDQAIKASGPQPVTVEIGLNNDPNRKALMLVPGDLTDLEALALVAAVIKVSDQLRAKRPSSRIALPS